MIVAMVMVILSVGLAFVQEHRSDNAAEQLRKMVHITATVRRKPAAEMLDPGDAYSGQEASIEELVPGDVVMLSAGDMVPTDVRLLAAKVVNEAALTGEARVIAPTCRADAGA